MSIGVPSKLGTVLATASFTPGAAFGSPPGPRQMVRPSGWASVTQGISPPKIEAGGAAWACWTTTNMNNATSATANLRI